MAEAEDVMAEAEDEEEEDVDAHEIRWNTHRCTSPRFHVGLSVLL